MKLIWAKYLKADDTAGKKAGEVVQIPESEFAVLKRFGLVEETAEPEAVKGEATDDAAFIEALDQRMAKRFDDFTKGLTAKAKTPRISVGDENELDDPTDGFKPGEFYTAVQKAATGGGVDPRLERRRKANGMSENVLADGGYAVPMETSGTIFNDIVAQDSLLPQCTLIPMNSNSMKLPAVNYTQQGQFGVTAYWEGEAAPIPPSKGGLRGPTLTLNKLTCLTPVTSELLEDGVAIEALINFWASEAMTFKINDAILNGTGAGQPTGIIPHASTVKVPRTTSGQIKAADIFNMAAAYWGSDANAKYVISKSDVGPALMGIQDPAGRYLFIGPGAFGNKPSDGLLGPKVVPSINAQPLGTPGDILLTDLKQYYVGYKAGGVKKAMSIHVYFATDEVAYRWTFRMDGRPMRDRTLAAARGSGVYGTSVVLTA